MNKRLLLLSILSLLFISISFAGEEQEIKNVKNLVIKSYANGAFNKLDTVAMKNGFHPDFSIYSVGYGAWKNYCLQPNYWVCYK